MRKRLLLISAAVLITGATVVVAQDQSIKAVIGNVFLQNTTPGTVQAGHASIGGTFRAGQVFAQQATATTIPVVGNNTAVGAGFAYGGSFSSGQQSGSGVRGTATATTGTTTGVYGETRSVDGRGVVGNGIGGLGVYGVGKYGVYGNGTLTGVVGQTSSDLTTAAGVEAVSVGGAPALIARSTVGGSAALFQGFTTVQGQFVVQGSFTEMSGRDTIGGLPFRAIWGNNQASTLELRKTGSQARALLVGSSDFSRIEFVSQNAIQAEVRASSNGTGSVTADLKNFVQPDPDDEERDIVYACVEGPEAAAYVRGTAKLVNGAAFVALPRHFQNVAVAEGMTVQLTATSADSEGLAVVSQSMKGFEVREMRRGRGNYSFHWRVEAVRRGFTDYKVYRSWEESAPSGLDRSTAMEARRANARRVYGIQYAGPRP